MRKLLVIIMLFMSFDASAQLYTLRNGQREPTFYYWGEHWIDQCRTGFLRYNLYGLGPGWAYASPTFLRFYTTPDTLKIIGIAGCANVYGYDKLLHVLFTTYHPFLSVFDTANRLPEYFQLYKATSSDPILLAEAPWDTAHPRYQIAYTRYVQGYYEDDSMPVYEVFFDKPIEVTDSFFVGGTAYNNFIHYDEALGRYVPHCFEHPLTYYLCATVEDMDDRPVCPMTPHKGLAVKNSTRHYVWRTPEIEQIDTCWHINDSISAYYYYWPWLFPIIDTTGMGLDGFQWLPGYGCDTVRTFHLLYVEGRTAYLSWNANADALFYEVSYGPEGTAPDQGVKVRCSTSMAVLDSLEPGRYVAYVRAHCAENAKSVWTDGETFRIQGSGGAIGEESSLADRYTAVMPNPATTQATVASSFAIHRIELYTAAGRHLQTTEPRGYMAAVDLTGLPAGAYLVRVQTAAGESIKKLLKR